MAEKKFDFLAAMVRIATNADTAMQQMAQFQNQAVNGFKKIQMAADAFTVSIAGKMARAMYNSIKATADQAENNLNLAASYGTTVENISRLDYATKLSGKSIESVGAAMKFLSKNAIDNRKDFDALGISTKGLNGATADGHTLLLRTIDYLNKQSDSGKRVSDAIKLMGRGATDILPLIGNLKELEAEADKVGATMTTASAQQFDAFGDNLQRIGTRWEGFKRTVLVDSLPVLNEWATAIGKGLDGLVKARDWMGDYFSGVGLAEARAKNQQDIQDAYVSMSPQAKANRDKMLAARQATQAAYEESKRKEQELIRLAGERAAAEAKAKEELIKQTEQLAKQAAAALVARNDAQRKAMESQFYAGSDLQPGMMGAPMYKVEEIGAGSKSFASQLAASQQAQDAYNSSLQEENEIRVRINAQIGESIAADRQRQMEQAQGFVQGMGMIAEGLQAVAGNNKALFIFQQALSIAQMIMDSSAAWAKASAQGGIYGFAVGAGIFAKLMAVVATVKSQKAPNPPKLKIPGAAEGAMVLREQVVKVAEYNRPEMIVPLDKADKYLDRGSRKQELIIRLADRRGFLRALSFDLRELERDEMLAGAR